MDIERGTATADGAGAARRSDQFYRAIAAHASDAFLVVDAGGAVVCESPNLAVLVGSPDGPVVGTTVAGVFEAADRGDAFALFERALSSPGTSFEGDVSVVVDGEPRCLRARITNLIEHPDVGGIVVNLHDVTEQRAAERELSRLAFHDPLTGLANRRLFVERVELAIASAGPRDVRPVVAYIDLDDFKAVNDRFGHEGGDQLLVHVARSVSAEVGQFATAARLGGDEFAVLCSDLAGPRQVAALELRLAAAVSRPLPLLGSVVSSDASIGVAVAQPGQDADALLRAADLAMYRSKARRPIPRAASGAAVLTLLHRRLLEA